MISVLFKITVLASVFMEGTCSKLKTIQMNHQILPITTGSIQYLASLSNIQHIKDVLNNILIPRVVGTKNHTKVFDYIKSELENLHWTTNIDLFEDETPFGRKTFKNIIATLNPNAERFLVFACHYDSKFFKDIEFVGATDSAVPCAMMLNLIKVMDKELKKIKPSHPVSLKLIFFDGEEAFVEWGPNDSIYGAKHLASVWDKNKTMCKSTNELVSDLDRIDIFVLLDIIGHKGTRFLSCSDNTLPWFARMSKIEDQLAELDLLDNNYQRYFHQRKYNGYIEDDHIPFLRKNVPILHLISIPFADAWHTERDNMTIIDMNIVEDINKILRVFVVQYLNIITQEETVTQKTPSKEL